MAAPNRKYELTKLHVLNSYLFGGCSNLKYSFCRPGRAQYSPLSYTPVFLQSYTPVVVCIIIIIIISSSSSSSSCCMSSRSGQWFHCDPEWHADVSSFIVSPHYFKMELRYYAKPVVDYQAY
jgi:hypothetical protein